MNYLLAMLTGAGGEGALSGDDAVNNAIAGLSAEAIDIVQKVVYILMGVLVAVLLIKGITTAMAVVRAADDPQVRQEKLSGFKYLAIGLGIGLVILALLATAVGIMNSYLEKAKI